ncbi:MAG: GNAT family N-acetyltransferase [Bacteroidales bacterium]|nr:GNAT family N-acetyltransferase [Bacteroidales bacterium]
MILEGGGIRLRAVEPEDLELLYKWENDEANWRLSNTLVPYSRFVLKNYISGSHKSLFETCQLRLMIDLQTEARTVGTIDLFDFDHFHLRAGIGILIADENDRHKGYASAALASLIKYSFDTLRLHQLWCNILDDNDESLRLFSRHGFTLCATKEEWIRINGSFVCEYMYQLINPRK